MGSRPDAKYAVNKTRPQSHPTGSQPPHWFPTNLHIERSQNRNTHRHNQEDHHQTIWYLKVSPIRQKNLDCGHTTNSTSFCNHWEKSVLPNQHWIPMRKWTLRKKYPNNQGSSSKIYHAGKAHRPVRHNQSTSVYRSSTGELIFKTQIPQASDLLQFWPNFNSENIKKVFPATKKM
jgi:hypothetical protein